MAVMSAPLQVFAFSVADVNALLQRSNVLLPISATETVEASVNIKPKYTDKKRQVPEKRTCYKDIYQGGEVCSTDYGTASGSTSVRYVVSQRTVSADTKDGFAAEGRAVVERFQTDRNFELLPSFAGGTVLSMVELTPYLDEMKRFNRPFQMEWIFDGERFFARLVEVPSAIWKALGNGNEDVARSIVGRWRQKPSVNASLLTMGLGTDLPADLRTELLQFKNIFFSDLNSIQVDPRTIRREQIDGRQAVTFNIRMSERAKQTMLEEKRRVAQNSGRKFDKKTALKEIQTDVADPLEMLTFSIDAENGNLLKYVSKERHVESNVVSCSVKGKKKTSSCKNEMIRTFQRVSDIRFRYDQTNPIVAPAVYENADIVNTTTTGVTP